MILGNILTSWITAEKELGIKIQKDFTITFKDKTERRYFLIQDFGSANGMIVLLEYHDNETKELSKLGYSWSVLNENSYGNYDRELFIDTLNDWGFFGKSNHKPEWYTGESWNA